MSESGTTIVQRFGARVRRLRLERGVSQEAFAHAAGLDRTYVSGIERGVRNVSLRTVERVARSLEVSLGDLFADL
jgi:transcriptional regulator with XRE-family HTH domain